MICYLVYLKFVYILYINHQRVLDQHLSSSSDLYLIYSCEEHRYAPRSNQGKGHALTNISINQPRLAVTTTSSPLPLLQSVLGPKALPIHSSCPALRAR